MPEASGLPAQQLSSYFRSSGLSVFRTLLLIFLQIAFYYHSVFALSGIFIFLKNHLRMPKYLPIVCIAIIVFASCRQKAEKPSFISLKVYKEYDSSRTFDTTATSKNTFRPVKIDVFYPSAQQPDSTAATLTYGDILDMYEQRFNFNNPIDSCKKMSADLATAFAGYFHIAPATKFLTYKTGIYNNLALPEGKHPLIIYAASMNGSAFDNPILFDSLASHGYVVAVVSSVGKFPGFMSSAVDVDEQVQDILFTIKQMKAQPYIDGDKIGVVSWSMGGTSAVKAAMLTKDIKCIASFDGTDLHAYGMDKDWDKEFDEIRAIPPSNFQAVTVPYMYLRSQHPDKIDSMYNSQALAASPNKYFVKFADAIHEDFSSFPIIAKQVDPTLKDIHTEYHASIQHLTLLFFDEHLKKEAGKNVGAFIDNLVKSDSAHYSKAEPKY
jgi:hypothetical protein